MSNSSKKRPWKQVKRVELARFVDIKQLREFIEIILIFAFLDDLQKMQPVDEFEIKSAKKCRWFKSNYYLQPAIGGERGEGGGRGSEVRREERRSKERDAESDADVEKSLNKVPMIILSSLLFDWMQFNHAQSNRNNQSELR